MSLSVCMIVKNEESCLKRCLDSIKDFADEIIIVDTGSSDKTKEIAKEYTKKVYDFTWVDDFSKARNFSLSFATKEWILVIDADELIEPENMKKIKDFSGKDEADAYILSTKNYTNKEDSFRFLYNTKKNQLNENYKGYVLIPAIRLFRKSNKIFYERNVHETVDKSIQDNKMKLISRQDIEIEHYGEEKGLNEKKAMLYLDIAKKEIEKEPENFMAHYNLSAYYERYFNDFENSLKHILLAYKYGLPETIALIGIAGSLINLKRYDEAVSILEQALSKGIKDAFIYYSLGRLYHMRKELDRSIEMYNIVVKYDNHPLGRLALAQLELVKKEKLEKEKKDKESDDGVVSYSFGFGDQE